MLKYIAIALLVLHSIESYGAAASASSSDPAYDSEGDRRAASHRVAEEGRVISAEDIEDLKRKADAGDGLSQFTLGVKYYNGYEVDVNIREAKRLWELASEKGIVAAYYNLGIMYHLGIEGEKDYEKAKYWWELGMESGDSSSIFNLGAYYSHGRGVKVNKFKAFELYLLKFLNGSNSVSFKRLS